MASGLAAVYSRTCQGRADIVARWLDRYRAWEERHVVVDLHAEKKVHCGRALATYTYTVGTLTALLVLLLVDGGTYRTLYGLVDGGAGR